MKIPKFVVVGGAVSTAALLGVAVAQASRAWPQVDIADLEQCRPVIGQVHKLEQAYIRNVAMRECNAPARFYSTESCRTARRWLSKSESQDDVVWFFEGNDRCQGTDYPCFGVKIYNTARSGAEARRWAKYFADKAAKPFGVTRGMDLWTAAREADTCVSGVWNSKYRMASEPPPPPVQVSETPPVDEPPVEPPTAQASDSAPIEVAVAAAPAAAPPPTEVKEPISTETAIADAATATATTIATAAAPAATTTATAAEAIATAAVAAAAPTTTAATAATDTPQPAAAKPPAPARTVLKPASAKGGESMKAVLALIEEGKTSEAIAMADQLAAKQPKGEANLTACKTRVLARQDLDKALVSCYSTGKPNDPAVLETRGQLHLLTGRHQDAWNDLNAAWTANQSNTTLYLRGLAAAGMGNTADALKDLAKAEAGEQGIMAAYEAKGFTLAAVMSGKPLVEDSAMGPAADVAAAAPEAKAEEPKADAAKDAAPAAVAANAAPAKEKTAAEPAVVASADAPKPTAVPAAPIVPLPNAVYPPDTEPPATPPAAASAAPAKPAKKPEAAVPVASSGNFSAATGSAVAVPGVSIPAVTDCLVPVAPGNGGRGAFKNKCSYPVRYTYCNIKGAEDAEQLTCGSETKFRAETIGANGSVPAVLGLSVAYFGCRSPTLPEVIYTSNNGLEGYCR